MIDTTQRLTPRVTRPPARSEALPTRWLASVSHPRLDDYVPAAATDIRVRFARVRRELQRERTNVRPLASWALYGSTSA